MGREQDGEARDLEDAQGTDRSTISPRRGSKHDALRRNQRCEDAVDLMDLAARRPEASGGHGRGLRWG